ncbi:hypothetical protein BTHI11S_01327 [Bosea thiooxidans]
MLAPSTAVADRDGPRRRAVRAAVPASAQDAADLLVRTTRLENQLRQMSGQIEQLQFENRRLTTLQSRRMSISA